MSAVIQSLKTSIRACLSHRRGQTLVEYALILAVIAIVMILVMSLLGAKIVVVFSAIANLLDTAQSSH